MEDMKENRRGQHGARDPVIGHPVELDAYSRKEGSEQQSQHRGCHDPMEHARHLRMPGHTCWYLGWEWMTFRRELTRLGEVPQIGSMNYEEHESCNHRHPYQEPCDVNRNSQSPGVDSPLQETHVACSTPPIARFTRFLVSGIL